MIRVLIVDDQPAIRSGIKIVLESSKDIEVVGEAANGAEGVALAAQLLPDVVLMDIRMPLMDGIEATRQIVERGTGRILILTTFGLEGYVYDALRAGASGFVLKDIDPAALIDAIHIVHEGESLLSPSITRVLVSEFARISTASQATGERDSQNIDLLTTREREVLEAIARGLSNAEIAETLFISQATTKTHISHLLSKLQARDRAQLVILAYENGIV